MVWQETLLITTFFFVVSEQRPPVIYVDSETELLEEIRPIRSMPLPDKYSFVTSISFEETPVTTTAFPEDVIRILRSTKDNEDTLSSEATTVQIHDITTISSEDAATTEDNEGFFAFFVKVSSKAAEGLMKKRSVEYLDEDDKDKDADNLEDLDTAANTVFRPLFAYRQQNEQRRRLRTLRTNT